MDEEKIRQEFEEWAIDEGFSVDRYIDSELYRYTKTQIAWGSWLAATRRADRKARLECERIALQYSQAYGQVDDAMAIARDIRATIKEVQT